MRIAMIGHKRIPSREGGVEIVVEELAVRMASQGHSVTVYNRGGHHVAGKENDSQSVSLREYRGVRIITVPTPDKKSLNAIVYAFLASIHALFCRYDVIHYHAEGSCAMLWLPKLFGIKTVATIHGLDWQRSKWGGFATKFLLAGEKIAAKKADRLIVLSGNIKRYFMETYNREASFIPNGISVPKLRDADLIRKNYGLEKNKFILFLARIVPEKGLHYLIQAYEKLSTDMPLVIAGGSSHTEGYMAEIKQMAARDERIIMTGFVQGRILEELYSNCYLYVLPSDIEGMPLSLLEAMSFGRRCLVSDIPENLEIVGDLAESFLKSDIKDLGRKMDLLLKKEVVAAWGEEQAETERNHVTEMYNWDSVTQKTLDLYQ